MRRGEGRGGVRERGEGEGERSRGEGRVGRGEWRREEGVKG